MTATVTRLVVRTGHPSEVHAERFIASLTPAETALVAEAILGGARCAAKDFAEERGFPRTTISGLVAVAAE